MKLPFKPQIFYKTLLLFLFLSFSSFSFSLSRQGFSCKTANFMDWKLSKEPNSYILLTAKAECLLKKNQDTIALQYLNQAIKNGGVYPAYLKAYYMETDGTFKKVKDSVRGSQIIDKVIATYKDVLFVINQIPNYPPKNRIDYVNYETNYLMMMDTFFIITELYMKRWFYQLRHHNSQLLKSSPSFNPFSETMQKDLGLEFFPQMIHFNGPLYSLNKLGKSAEECINTPYIKYWDAELYNNYIEGCRVYKNFSKKIKPLELERVTLAKSCKDFIIAETRSCKKYIEVLETIVTEYKIIAKKIKELGF